VAEADGNRTRRGPFDPPNMLAPLCATFSVVSQPLADTLTRGLPTSARPSAMVGVTAPEQELVSASPLRSARDPGVGEGGCSANRGLGLLNPTGRYSHDGGDSHSNHDDEQHY